MPDTVRTLAALQALLADNVTEDISPQDVRDFLVSAWSPGWVRYLNHRLPGETAHADDDFFGVDSSADYTEITPAGGGTAAWNWDQGCLSCVYNSQANDDYAAQVKALTATGPPITIETAVTAMTADQTADIMGLCFSDGNTSTDSAIFFVWYMTSTGANGFEFFEGTFDNAPSGATAFIPFSNGMTPLTLMNLRLIWSAANTFKAQVGILGSWHDLGIGTEAFTLTPTHFGPAVSADGATSPTFSGFHYLRVYESDPTV